MHKQYCLLPILIMLLLGISSCKKDDKKNKKPDYELVNSSNWKTLGKDVIGAGNSGGIQIVTLSLNLLSPDILRWMYAVTTPNYTNEQREMRVTPTDELTILDKFLAPTSKYHLKVINNGHEWQMNADANNEHKLWTYKDGKIVDGQHLTDDVPSFPRYQDYLEIASDGFLVSGNWNDWQVAHYSFETQKWKRNWVSAQGRCVQTRYKGKTIVVRLDESKVDVYTEGDVPETSNYQTLYRMELLKTIAIPSSQSREIAYSVLYGKDYYIAYENSMINNLKVYKLDLETFDLSLVQDLTLPARLQSGFQQKFYDQGIDDNSNQMVIDEVGNVYINERDDQKYSIRKYLVSGGSEVVLKTEELKNGTSILSIRYFNGKLYAGLLFQELDQSINTNYYQNYLQLARMK